MVRAVVGVRDLMLKMRPGGMNRRREGGRFDPRRPPVGVSPSGRRVDRALPLPPRSPLLAYLECAAREGCWDE
jgi:hypothetical protein